MAEDSSKKRPPSDDDRNLVVVDEDFANADAEDRLWLFWERNKNLIVRGTTAVVLAIIGAIVVNEGWCIITSSRFNVPTSIQFILIF